MIQKIILITGSIILVIFTGKVCIAGMPQSWVWPVYETTEPVEKEITVVEHYNYRESKYEPAVIIQPVQKDAQKYETPEEAMVTRVSAMMAYDYEWWLTTWDPASKSIYLEKEKAAGRTKDYWIQWWKDTFQFSRYELVRRIDTGSYTALIYRMINLTNKDDNSSMEFPSVFHKSNGRWLTTVDLARDSLLLSSPWVSGKSLEEKTIR